jgi:hypothetical protein
MIFLQELCLSMEASGTITRSSTRNKNEWRQCFAPLYDGSQLFYSTSSFTSASVSLTPTVVLVK